MATWDAGAPALRGADRFGRPHVGDDRREVGVLNSFLPVSQLNHRTIHTVELEAAELNAERRAPLLERVPA